jgi:hypothetical protein
LSCPSDGVVIWVVVVGAMKLSENLLVPIVAKTHNVIEPHFFALLNHGVEHGVVKIFIVFSINIPHLHNGHHVLGNQLGVPYDGLVEILMEITPKPGL